MRQLAEIGHDLLDVVIDEQGAGTVEHDVRIIGQPPQLASEFILIDKAGILRETKQVIGILMDHGYGLVVIGADDKEQAADHADNYAGKQIEEHHGEHSD